VVEQLVWAAIKFAAVLGFMSFNAIFLVWLERKVAGFIQYRYGPMVTGKPHGWLQTIADAVKLLAKEDIIPALADRKIFILAPLVMIVPTFLLHIVIPFGPNLIVKDLEMGVLYFFAVSGFTTLAVVMAGWASNNKYSLLGAIRAIAQLIGSSLTRRFHEYAGDCAEPSKLAVRYPPADRFLGLLYRGLGRTQSRSLRSLRGRIGVGGRVQYRVLGNALGLLLSGGVRQSSSDERDDSHTLSGWLAGADLTPARLVFTQDLSGGLCDYLVPLDLPPGATRSTE